MRWAQSRRDDFGGSPAATGHETVSWLGRATPLDGDARLVYEAVVKADISRYADVVTYVAESLFAEDYERVGPTGDVGFFRTWYRVLARRILRRLDGSVISIAHDGPAASDGG